MIEGFNIEVKRSDRRRTASLQIYPDSRIVVSVPIFYPDTRISKLILEKKNWIQKKLHEIAQVGPARPERNFENGDSFFLIGKEYRLNIIYSEVTDVILKEHTIFVSVSPRLKPEKQQKRIRELMREWYIQFALEEFKERSAVYAAKLKVSPKSISVKDFKSRWGACKSSGEIVYNWRLVMAPLEVFDYVVVHELCHLRVFSHSSKFWALVNSVFPEYKRVTKQLKLLDYKGELKF
jgi:predicted metal-dependent hydrolase